MSDERDRRRAAANEAFVREVQGWLADEGRYDGDVDGWAGDLTADAFAAATGRPRRTLPAFPAGAWPAPDERSLLAYFGEPGTGNLVEVDLPYPMRLAWQPGTVVRSTRCHRLVADSLRACLGAVLEHYGSVEAVRAARMDLYGGCYAYRRQRGGRALSLHAWGAAIDLDPERNGMATPWPAVASMPAAVVDIFEAAGWKSGARAWGRDAMHFQATR